MKRLLISAISCVALLTPSMYAADSNVPAPEAAPSEVSAPNPAPQEGSSESMLKKVLASLPKISGYLQTGYNYNSVGKGSSSFQAKRLRLIMDGNVGEKVSFRLQIEAFNGIAGSVNGNGQKNIQVMDAFATAKILPSFQVRAGQYYLPIGYENYDISPATLETVDFSNICYRMVCRNPLAYNLVDYGRDLGVMVFGDLLPSDKGFNYLTYNLSLSNGSIPCKDDNNKSKDIVAALTVRPAKFLNIKGAFNWGEYASSLGGVGAYKYQPMTRMVAGAWYNDPNGLDLRAEYGHIQSSANGNKIVNENGMYVLAGYHAGKFLPVVRYDMYRDKVNKATLNNYDRVLAGLTFQVLKNLKIQANYAYTMYTDESKVTNGDKSGSSQILLMGLFKF